MSTRVIWKYKLPAGPGMYNLDMPRDAEVIAIQTQNEDIALWAFLRSSDQMIYGKRTFQVVFTGEEFEYSGMAYLGTVQIDRLVYHVFEILKEK